MNHCSRNREKDAKHMRFHTFVQKTLDCLPRNALGTPSWAHALGSRARPEHLHGKPRFEAPVDHLAPKLRFSLRRLLKNIHPRTSLHELGE